MRRWLLAVLAAAIIAATAWIVSSADMPNSPAVLAGARSPIPLEARRAAFDRWRAEDPARRREFDAFERYLAASDVADVVPAWTLLRANATKSARCRAEAFVIPPRRLWPNILPALRLTRERIIPAIGRVEVYSAFRDPALNSCSRGAGRSRHMSFHALDLVPLDQPDARRSFTRLCAAWRAAGAGSRWGFGGYLDLDRPKENRIGRFHVDGTGWRTWGFSYSRASSICNRL